MTEINPEQKRSIQTSLWLLDEMLCIFEHFISRKEFASILYHEINTLTEEQCSTVKNEITILRKLIKEIAGELDLSEHTRYIGKAIQSMCTHCITDNLFSLTGKKLSAYGEVSPALTSYLHPRITEIISRLEDIAKIGDASVKK